MSAEEAIARAKAIAERLAGSNAAPSLAPDDASAPPTDVNAIADAALAAALGQTSGTDTSGSKRKRWGDSSDAVDDALAQAMNKRPATGGSEVTQKIPIPVEQYPGYNFIGLLIGPGGSKQRELVQQAGGNVRISIRGKGSSMSNANPGQPEEPLHVMLEGNASNVEIAEQLIRELLENPEKAQAEKDRQLKSISGSTYTPKPVAQLIGAAGHYGPEPGAEVIEEMIGIPNAFVGFIIGKGGESITSMQRKTGCRVQIQKEHEMEPGSTQRIITLVASTPEAISMCRSIIEDMVQERAKLNEQSRGGGSSFAITGPGNSAASQAAQLQRALAEGQAHTIVQVPNNDVGLIIGKGGSTIKSIQERSGANVQIPQQPDHDNPAIRTVNITHPNREGAEFAKTLIEEVLASKLSAGTASYSGGASAPSGSDVTIQVQIPDQDVGMCIGKSGCVIRELQARTNTKIQIPNQCAPGSIYRMATVTGPAASCQLIQQIIARISAEQSSQFVMNGECFQQLQQGQPYGQYYGQQYGATGQYGATQQQGDYSAQWAAYYAAQGAAATATTGAAAAPVTGTATISSTPAADQYYEDFFRYSYHYGEAAARAAYGAWSPPEGTPNPYGVNPNVSAPPSGTESQTSSSTPAQASAVESTTVAASEVKDSSVRRGVSNLPAWMTKG